MVGTGRSATLQPLGGRLWPWLLLRLLFAQAGLPKIIPKRCSLGAAAPRAGEPQGSCLRLLASTQRPGGHLQAAAESTLGAG